MNYWLKRGLIVAALGAGALLGGASIASADEAGRDTVVSAPVEVSDVTVRVLGGTGAAAAAPDAGSPADGALVSAPVQVSGIDVEVLDAGRADQPAPSPEP